MFYTITTDAAGWITGNGVSEHAPRPTTRTVPAALGHALGLHPPIAAVRAGRVVLPQDDRILWRRLRAAGLNGPEAAGYRHALAELRALLPDDIPADLPVPDAVPIDAPGTPRHDFPDVPGLRLRRLTADDLDRLAPLASETGVYAQPCTDGCRPPEAHVWLQLATRIDRPDAWQLALEFNGTPLQYELIEFDVHAGPTVGLTVHLTRERPSWFWREAERPVFTALRAMGHRVLRSRTRADRPDWIAALKRNYAAVQVGELRASAVLEFPLDRPATFQGWPAPRSVGPAWQWEAGASRLIEVPPEGLAPVRAWLAEAWRLDATKRTQVLAMLEAWTLLDRGTVLVGTVAGEIRNVRVVRPRRAGVSSVAWLGPQFDEPAQADLLEGAKVWHRSVGYTTATSFTPEANWSHPRVQAYAAKAGLRQVARRTFPGGVFVETELPL